MKYSCGGSLANRFRKLCFLSGSGSLGEEGGIGLRGGRILAQGACFIDALMPSVTGRLQPMGGSIWIMEYL